MSIGLLLAGNRLPFHEMTAVIGPFLLGCTFARAIGVGYVPRFGMTIGAWVFLMALILFPYLAAGQTLALGLMTSGIALVFTLAAAGNECSRFWIWKPLIVLGDVSYSLYLVHTLVQKLVYELAPSARFADRSVVVRLLVLGGYAAAIGLATWLAHICIDVYVRKSLRRACFL